MANLHVSFQNYLSHFSQICNEKVESILLERDVQNYIAKSVEMCMLMAATDPPVVIYYPEWIPIRQREKAQLVDDVKDASTEGENNTNDVGADTISDKDGAIGGENSINDVGGDTHSDKDVSTGGENSTNDEGAGTNVNKDAATEGENNNNDEGTATMGNIEDGEGPTPKTKAVADATEPERNRNESFNKLLYKAYTKRGTFIEFVVWPALLLNENGPLLCKGVAQGTQLSSFNEVTTPFIWWK